MSLKVRRFEETDYPILERWISDWGWINWEIDKISPYSYIVENNDTPILFTSFYKYEGVPGGCIGITLSNKYESRYVVGKALSLGFNHIIDEAKRLGIGILIYSTDKESKNIFDFFIRKGGKITDNGNAFIGTLSLNDYNTDFFHGLKNDIDRSI